MQKFVDRLSAEKNFPPGQAERLAEKLAGLLRMIPTGRKYHDLGPEIKGFYTDSGLENSDSFHRLVLSQLISGFDMDRVPFRLPPEMTARYEQEFDRMRRNLEDEAFVFGWQNDLFAKDVAIASGRLVPAGPGLVDISGVPRSLAWRGGPGQFFRFLGMLLFRLGGRRPMLNVHMHMANVENFTPEGWQDFYHLAGEILALNPSLRGLVRHAWFFDPRVAEISPKLAYLRQIPESRGAGVYYYCDEGGDSGALKRSPTRRALFDRGEYIPRVYYLLWPRNALISYARSL